VSLLPVTITIPCRLTGRHSARHGTVSSHYCESVLGNQSVTLLQCQVNLPDQLAPGGASYGADNQLAVLKLNRSNPMTSVVKKVKSLAGNTEYQLSPYLARASWLLGRIGSAVRLIDCKSCESTVDWNCRSLAEGTNNTKKHLVGSVALLVARRTNDRKVAGSRPTKVVCISVDR